MKTKVFLLISLCMAFFLSFSCDKEKDAVHSDKFVVKVDIEGLAGKHLPGFYLYREWFRGMTGRDYTFKRDSDTAMLSIAAGLYKSAEAADSIARDYFMTVSAVFTEGLQPGSPVGDKYWYVGLDTMHPEAIAFIRKNALFIMHGNEKYSDIMQLAKKIDDDIVKDAGYIELKNTILLPEIFSITASKTVMKEGETSKITLHASDPDNESLEYYGYGIGHYEPDPENIFTLNAMSDFIGDPFYGSHVYWFMVINKSNVLSEIAEFEIIISQ